MGFVFDKKPTIEIDGRLYECDPTDINLIEGVSQNYPKILALGIEFEEMNAVGDAVGKIQGNLQNNVNVNPNRNPYFKNYPGYAKGTQSAGKGWRLVGEQGPELLYLRGGEKILTASQSMAWNAAYGGRIPDRALNQTINLNVNGIEQMNEVVNWYTNRQQMARAR